MSWIKDKAKVAEYAVLRIRVVLLFFLSALFFLYAYLNNGLRPLYAGSRQFALGWYGWYDQGKYYAMAKDLAHFTLSAKNYLYGLGYPILGALFYRLVPRDPFLIPDLLIFATVVVLTYLIARRFMTDTQAFVVVLLLLFGTSLIDLFVVPWNSTVSALALAVIVYLAVSGDLNYTKSALIGLALGWMLAARYIDSFLIIPAVILLFWKVRRQKEVLFQIGTMSIAFILIVAIVLLSHYFVFGSPLKTPYAYHRVLGKSYGSQDIRFFVPTKIPTSLLGAFVYPHYFENVWARPLLLNAFFFVFAPVGVYFALRKKQEWHLVVGLSLSLGISVLVYGASQGVSASCLQFGCLHYFKMWYPFLTIFSVLGLVKLWQLVEEHTSRRQR